jgi:phage terminase small subunit
MAKKGANLDNLPIPDPPEHLSDRSKGIWCDVIDEPCSPGRLVLVQTALEALDRADEARKQVEKEGLTTTTKTTGAVHVHPLLKVERDNRALFARIWHGQLRLHWDYRTDGHSI